jgi:hypothetical protein
LLLIRAMPSRRPGSATTTFTALVDCRETSARRRGCSGSPRIRATPSR